MRRPAPTIWLRTPSRYAGLSCRRARIGLALLALLVALSFTVMRPARLPPGMAFRVQNNESESDLALYETIVEEVRHGGDYYLVTARELRARPGYPLRPFVTFRLPVLASVQAALPPVATLAMLFGLAAAVAVVWSRRIGAAIPARAPRAIATMLLAAGMVTFVQSGLVAMHEIWAALLVALSLGIRGSGRWIEAVAIALVAMLVRETAAPYVLLMAALAWRDGERREAIGWAAALVLFAGVLAAHGWAVHRVTGPLDTPSDGWSGLNGFRFFVSSISLASPLQLLPLWIVAPTVALALFGWTAWNSPTALRMALLLAGYAVLLSVFARLNNFYWALMVAPIFLVGLAFAPDGLRDLWRAALDRRRISVTRVAR